MQVHSAEMSDPYCLDQLAAKLEAGGTLETREQAWAIEEAYRMLRAYNSLDRVQAEHDREVAEHQAEVMGYQSELADLLEKLNRLEQKLEVQSYELGFLRRRAKPHEGVEVKTSP